MICDSGGWQWQHPFSIHKLIHVARGNRAIRLPFLAQSFHQGRSRQCLESIQSLHSSPNNEVPNRKNIRAVKRENHEHVNRPRPNPLNQGKLLVQRLIVHLQDSRIRENPIDVLGGEVVEVTRFGSGDSNLPELNRREGENDVGENRIAAAAEGDEAGFDGGGCFVGELLRDDALREGEEGGDDDVV